MPRPQHSTDAARVAADAILEAAPPSVDRRSLLVGGGLGVTTLVLPSALSAASVPTVEPSGGAFSYPANAGVLLHWTAFDTTATPTAVAGTAAGGVSATGTHGRGGTGTGIGDDPRVVADGSTTTYTQASGTLTGSSSGASVAISADFGGAYRGAAGNLDLAIVSTGGSLTAAVADGTLTVDLGGADRTAGDVATAISAIAGLTASSATGTFTTADAGGAYPALSGGADVPDASLWDVVSTTNQLTLTGASASPHLEWTITNSTGSSMTVSTLVLYRFRSLGALNLAFYVSTSAGFASPVLRRTAAFDGDLTRHLVVPLASGEGAVLANGETLTVRAFPYSTPTARTVRLIRYSSTDGGALQGLLGVDAIQTAVVGTTAQTGTHASAFIGLAAA